MGSLGETSFVQNTMRRGAAGVVVVGSKRHSARVRAEMFNASDGIYTDPFHSPIDAGPNMFGRVVPWFGGLRMIARRLSS